MKDDSFEIEINFWVNGPRTIDESPPSPLWVEINFNFKEPTGIDLKFLTKGLSLE